MHCLWPLQCTLFVGIGRTRVLFVATNSTYELEELVYCLWPLLRIGRTRGDYYELEEHIHVLFVDTTRKVILTQIVYSNNIIVSNSIIGVINTPSELYLPTPNSLFVCPTIVLVRTTVSVLLLYLETVPPLLPSPWTNAFDWRQKFLTNFFVPIGHS